ncbi:MAG TPA: hypothetical protein ENF49_00465 [Candidatus Altiarchaeales archaeon]|nr:hypothetical protein [Candidatus Altiarchaeales archaeon]HEX54591.1 hypothetical protein [Candidatus Altiarchaeales archaeon]
MDRDLLELKRRLESEFEELDNMEMEEGKESIENIDREDTQTEIECSFALMENHRENAHKYFLSKREKGIFGRGEEIAEIGLRYAPIGKFEVVKSIRLKKGMIITREIQKDIRNYFYVSMSTKDIFFVRVDKMRKQLVNSDILCILERLPENARSLLLDFVEFRKFKFSQLRNPVDEEARIILMQMDLIELDKSVSGVVKDVLKEAIGDYWGIGDYDMKLKLYFPRFSDKTFDLAKFIEIRNSVDNSIERDPIEFDSEEISYSLGELFNGTAYFNEIIYMPYYFCRYVSGDETESERYELYFPVKFL